MDSATAARLLERQRELALLDAAVARAARGAGGLVLVEGPAGIGKSQLLAAAREQAAAAGMRVLSARGVELEREFGFGVVRQLLEWVVAVAEPETRESWLAGAAALAEPLVSGRPHAEEGSATDSSFSRLHGLYWLCANVAAERPLLLAVDDLHWSDEPSLEFLAFLARRLDTIPVLLVAATRPVSGEDGARASALGAEPEAALIRPGALSPAAVAARVRCELGDTAVEAFCAACHEITAGNPLLLEELLREAAAEGIRPVQSGAARVRALGPRGVSTVVLLRISRLPAGATELARAIAVLGDSADLAVAAELAKLDEHAAPRLAAALERADVVQAHGPGLSFVHPIVRTAIYEDMPAAERSLAHARAAKLLSARGAASEALAAHVLATAPAGDGAVVEILEVAAQRALALGAPGAAVAYLRRALAEPPLPECRPSVVAHLGLAEARTGSPEAVQRLEEALAAPLEERDRAEAALTLASVLKFGGGRPRRALDVLREAHARVDDPELAARLNAELISSGLISLEANLLLRGELTALAEPAGEPQGLRDLFALAGIAFMEAASGRDARRAAELARRAVSARALPVDPAAGGHAYSLAGVALLFADELDDAEAVFSRIIEEARDAASDFGYAVGCCLRSLVAYRRGALSDAVADALAVIDVAQEGVRARAMLPLAYATLGYASLELELPDGLDARALLEREDGDADALPYTEFLQARALVRAASGDLRGALDELLAAGRRDLSWGAANPGVTCWRSNAALLHLALGEPEHARRLAAEELELAKRFGAARPLGIALRAAGLVEGGEAGIRLQRQGVEVLEPSTARLELARALIDLGAALRRANERRASRDPLSRGRELAEDCGATRLAERALQELLASGARPRTSALAGVRALTPSERRVVDMASQGMTNPQIAQALFLSKKTVESHLRNAYGKLDIRSRQELPQALAAAPRPTQSPPVGSPLPVPGAADAANAGGPAPGNLAMP